MKSIIIVMSCLPLFVYGMNDRNPLENASDSNSIQQSIQVTPQSNISENRFKECFEDETEMIQTLGKMLSDPGISAKMKEQTQSRLLKFLFFRSDLLDQIRPFLNTLISVKSLPSVYRTRSFLNYLKENGIQTDEANQEIKDFQYDIKQIVKDDNADKLQQYPESCSLLIRDSLFEAEHICIPILHYSAMNGAIKCFKFLLLNGADPQKTLSDCGRNYSQWNCLPIAVAFGRLEIIKYLKEMGLNELDDPAVWEAAALTHRYEFLEWLINQQDEAKDFGACRIKAIEAAVKANNLNGLELLVSQKLRFSEWKIFPPVIEIESLQVGASNPVKGLNVMLSEHSEIFPRSKDRIIQQLSSLPVIKKQKGGLIDFSFIPSSDAVTGVYIDKSSVVVTSFPKKSVFYSDDREFLPLLHIAAQFDNVEAGKFLLSQGLQLNGCGYWTRNTTPLCIAAENGSIHIAKFFISNDANINEKNGNRETPLKLARERKESKMEQLLLSLGATE